MADENEINKEESATSLTRDSSNHIRGDKYSLFDWWSQTNAVNVRRRKTPKEPKPQKKDKPRKSWDEKKRWKRQRVQLLVS